MAKTEFSLISEANNCKTYTLTKHDAKTNKDVTITFTDTDGDGLDTNDAFVLSGGKISVFTAQEIRKAITSGVKGQPYNSRDYREKTGPNADPDVANLKEVRKFENIQADEKYRLGSVFSHLPREPKPAPTPAAPATTTEAAPATPATESLAPAEVTPAPASNTPPASTPDANPAPAASAPTTPAPAPAAPAPTPAPASETKPAPAPAASAPATPAPTPATPAPAAPAPAPAPAASAPATPAPAAKPETPPAPPVKAENLSAPRGESTPLSRPTSVAPSQPTQQVQQPIYSYTPGAYAPPAPSTGFNLGSMLLGALGGIGLMMSLGEIFGGSGGFGSFGGFGGFGFGGFGRPHHFEFLRPHHSFEFNHSPFAFRHEPFGALDFHGGWHGGSFGRFGRHC